LVVDILCTVTRVLCGDRHLVVVNRQAAFVRIVIIVVAGWGDALEKVAGGTRKRKTQSGSHSCSRRL
jgi:hypothetical protein